MKPWAWLDSIAENHFFSLSCLLFPHVRATPNYTENPYFDRAWAQRLYLSPTSPLLAELDFPADFSIESTPLVTFRRVDLLLNKEDLETLYQNTYRTEAEDEDPTATNVTTKSLFSEEQAWSLSPSEYMPIFLASPPEANFGTMVVSTGGHWTTTLMSAFRDEEAGDEAGYGIEGVKSFFKVAMRTWAGEVQDAIGAYRRNGGTRPKQVVVRAYLPGHEDCHNHREPWTVIAPYRWRWYNWPWIRDFNTIFQVSATIFNNARAAFFYILALLMWDDILRISLHINQDVLATTEFPDIFYLPIDHPGRLRPDAVRHASS